MKYRVLIADDHQIVREGLRALIDDENDMEVVGLARNGRQAVQMCRKLEPDMVIMDIAMPELNGIEATRQIVKEVQGVKIIALSMYSDKQLIDGILRAGVSGYLLKESAFEELIKAMRIVCKGRKYLSPEVTDVVLRNFSTTPSEKMDPETSALTLREREVLQLIVEGFTTRKIAEQLTISVKTVESHRRKIMEKLNLHTVAELTKYAVRKGITSIE